MEAYVIREFGGPELFEKTDLPVPELRPGHVLIRVAATSVNPVDTRIRQGKIKVGPDLPAVLHGDVAGVVERVAPDVVQFRPGDEVFGCAGGVKGLGGALAEYMLADVDLIAVKPASLTMAQAAALPLVSITAWEALIERAQLHHGQRVLVHGATGGVSHVAIQLAKWAGATVYSTVSSPEKSAIARSLGADEAIDYRNQTVEEYVQAYTGGKGFDVVFDTVGGANLDRSFEAAALNGVVAATAARSTHDLSPMHSKGLSLHVVFMLIPLLYGFGRVHHSRILQQAAQLVEEGHLRPLLDPHQFTFDQVGDAHRLAESGDAVGKVVLTR